ncbi:prefoldin subunit 5 [Frankliniella occidentalis]|uniref:Prefoldin subunit 5 n=1 Tax=Frankliniella occidentalis TaxID=133901 RepID=A0A6J1SN07_FRAOC|nr:prefoldin subunit 5 [Frankliniella occidentalis]
MSIASKPGAGGENMMEIDITKLNLQQLSQLKQRLEQELQMYQSSLQSLKVAQTRYQNSKESIEKITPDCKGKEILVPLTGSIYVPGKIADAGSVIIDIGTGYYVQKDLDSAKDYMKRRVGFVTEQMEKIQAMGQEKSMIKDAVMEVMEGKIQQEIGLQKAALARAAAAGKT